MFDIQGPSSIFAAVVPPADVAASPAGPSRVPLERLEAQICEPADRGRVTVYEPEDCDERYRQYLERTPRRTGPTLIPIQV